MIPCECEGSQPLVSSFFRSIVKTFENEEVYFELKSNSIDCKNAMILVSYVNKKTNQKFEGRVKIDNIINYIQNKQLFENIIRNGIMVTKI